MIEFPRHLLDIESLRREQIEELLSLSARFKRERAAARQGQSSLTARRGLLPGRVVVTLFFEASTRTRGSFEVAAHALGAEVLAFSLVTNLAAGLGDEKLSHLDVIATGQAAADRCAELLVGSLDQIGRPSSSSDSASSAASR